MLADEFGSLADNLQVHQTVLGCGDAVTRTCIGRYYYQVFHVVQTWLMRDFAVTWQRMAGKTHQNLRDCCAELARDLNNRDFLKLHLKLKALHDLRVRADYKLDEHLSRGDLMMVKQERDRVIALVQTLQQQYSSL